MQLIPTNIQFNTQPSTQPSPLPSQRYRLSSSTANSPNPYKLLSQSKYTPYLNYPTVNQVSNKTFHQGRQSKAYSAFYSKPQLDHPKKSPMEITYSNTLIQTQPIIQSKQSPILNKLQSTNQALKSILKDKENQILELKSAKIKLKAQNQHYLAKIHNLEAMLGEGVSSQLTQQLHSPQAHHSCTQHNQQMQLKQSNNHLKQALQTKQQQQHQQITTLKQQITTLKQQITTLKQQITSILNQHQLQFKIINLNHQQQLKQLHSQYQTQIETNNNHQLQIKQLQKQTQTISTDSKHQKDKIIRKMNEKVDQTIKRAKDIQSQSNNILIELQQAAQSKDTQIKQLQKKLKSTSNENIKNIQLINQMRCQNNQLNQQITNLTKNLQLIKTVQYQCITELKQQCLRKLQFQSMYQKLKRENQKIKQDKQKCCAKIKIVTNQKQQTIKKNTQDINRIKLQFQVRTQKNKFESQMILEKTKIDFEEIIKKKEQQFQRYKLTVENNNNKHRSQIEDYKQTYKSIKNQKDSMQIHKDGIINKLKTQIQMLKESLQKSHDQFISYSNEKIKYTNFKQLYDKKQKDIQQLNYQIKLLHQNIWSLEKNEQNIKQQYKIAIQQIQEQKLEIKKYYQAKLENQSIIQAKQILITNENNRGKTNSSNISQDSVEIIQNIKNTVIQIARDKQDKIENYQINQSQEQIKIQKEQNKKLDEGICHLNNSQTIKDISKSSNYLLQEKDQIIKQLNQSVQGYKQIVGSLKQRIQKYQYQVSNIEKIQNNRNYGLIYQFYQQILQIFNIQWKEQFQPPQQQLILSINMLTKRIQDLMNALNLLETHLQRITGQNIYMKDQHEKILKKCQFMIQNAQQQNDDLIQRCNQGCKKLESAEEYINILQKMIQQCNLDCIAANVSKIQLKMIIKNLNDVKSCQSTQCDFYKNDHNQIQRSNDHFNEITKNIIEITKEYEIYKKIQENQNIKHKVKYKEQIKNNSIDNRDTYLSIAPKKPKSLNENKLDDSQQALQLQE